jgi:hypothetical protein
LLLITQSKRGLLLVDCFDALAVTEARKLPRGASRSKRPHLSAANF